MSMGQERGKSKMDSLQKFLPDEVARIRTALQVAAGCDFLQASEEYERQRNTFISKCRQVPLGSESFLVVLRRWNSYTPSLPTPDQSRNALSQYSVGGGYFLFLQSDEEHLGPGCVRPGYGLVVDPGYNFIHNYGAAGFALDDIDGILLTHAHNDHTNDFESLLSLLYQRNHRNAGKKEPKTVDLFLNVGSFKKFSNYLDLARKDPQDHIGHVVVMSPGQSHVIPGRDDIDASLLTLYTKHHEIVTADYALGLCVTIGGRTVLFSGDTGWDLETSLRNEAFLRAHEVYTREEMDKGNVDLLVAHIGTVTRKEVYLTPMTPLKDVFYDKHLGLLGVIAICEQWKPQTCVVSEFGEELTRSRLPLVREIETTLRKLPSSVHCFPGDIGLFLFLDSARALCYFKESLIDAKDLSYDEGNSDGVTAIKYFSNSSVSELGAEPRANLVKTISMTKGLQLYRKFTSGNKTKAELQAAFDALQWWENDPSSDYSSEAVECLCALSAVIDTPDDLIRVLKRNPHVSEISQVLADYYVPADLVRILDDLAMVCYAAGFGCADPSSPLDRALLKHYADVPAAIVEDCLQGRYLDARAKLDQIRERKIDDVWASVSEEERLHILFEDRPDTRTLAINDAERAALGINASYLALAAGLKEKVNVVVARESTKQCWQMGAPTLDIIKDGLQDILSSGKGQSSKEELEGALAQCAVLEAIEAKIKALAETGMHLLKDLGVKVEEWVPPHELLFFVSYHLQKLSSQENPDERIAKFFQELDEFLKTPQK